MRYAIEKAENGFVVTDCNDDKFVFTSLVGMLQYLVEELNDDDAGCKIDIDVTWT